MAPAIKGTPAKLAWKLFPLAGNGLTSNWRTGTE
jgi:hypothetical protein